MGRPASVGALSKRSEWACAIGCFFLPPLRLGRAPGFRRRSPVALRTFDASGLPFTSGSSSCSSSPFSPSSRAPGLEAELVGKASILKRGELAALQQRLLWPTGGDG